MKKKPARKTAKESTTLYDAFTYFTILTCLISAFTIGYIVRTLQEEEQQPIEQLDFINNDMLEAKYEELSNKESTNLTEILNMLAISIEWNNQLYSDLHEDVQRTKYEYMEESKQCQVKKDRVYHSTTGSSMSPTIPHHAHTIVQTYDNETELVPGDIIVYKDGDSKVSHRVFAVYNDKIYVKGDNNFATEKVMYEDITHVVCGVVWGEI